MTMKNDKTQCLANRDTYYRYLFNEPMVEFAYMNDTLPVFLATVQEYLKENHAPPRDIQRVIAYARSEILATATELLGKLGPQDLMEVATRLGPATDGTGVIVRLLISSDEPPVTWETARFTVPEDGTAMPRPGQP